MAEAIAGSGKQPLKTVEQISAGGVAFRRAGAVFEIALIKTAGEGRWQLPKGIVDKGETPEQAALREVREEAGIDCEIVAELEVIEYWFVASYDGERKRYHKYVHFYLMKYVGGDVGEHDHEVSEARWIDHAKALEMLAFEGEQKVVALAAMHLA